LQKLIAIRENLNKLIHMMHFKIFDVLRYDIGAKRARDKA
jgi:hypothetical protein